MSLLLKDKHIVLSEYLYSIKTLLAPSMQAVREGMLWMVPCLMLSALILFTSSVVDFLFDGRPHWVDALFNIYMKIMRIFPFLLTSAISYMLAFQYRLPRPPTALISITLLAITYPLFPDENTMQTVEIVLAIFTPLYSIPILAYLNRIEFLKLADYSNVGNAVNESMNLIIPTFLTAIPVVIVSMFVIFVTGNLLDLDQAPFDYANEPYQFGVMFAALNSLLWFVGVHGYFALLPLVELLQEACMFNYSSVNAGGEGHYHMNLAFMAAFVFIGGSGATFSFILACLYGAREKSLRLIAIASIPLAVINVNELLLFGLPIIFNPRLLIPFVLVPIINVCVGLMAIESGLVTSPSVSVPFLSPVLFNAWISTEGDINAVILQLVNVAIGALVYMPTVLKLDKEWSGKKIYFASLDSTYTRRREEAEALTDDPVIYANISRKNQKTLESALEGLSRREFCLEYQPQFCRKNERLTGCEALVRVIDEAGNIEYPTQFLPWLEKGGLLKDLDLWIFRQVTEDVRSWEAAGYSIPVSVNITGETLMDETAIREIESLIAPYHGRINIEIMESTLILNESKLKRTLSRLKKLGVGIYIDDFGTGFSALSYLNKFDMDAIKVDRSFVMALSSLKGQRVFSSIINIATQLGLHVVVEGVDDIDQFEHIPVSQQISIQGWYYSKSISAELMVKTYAEHLKALRPSNNNSL
ncbi:EAL domain-containing protein [Parasalinivibrio latis]|uniref:EAL domain-containing protein n=1 Tax=Parasalinivibrio latis TaxID=2952610 RepID=UPI0030E19F1C